MGQMEEVELMMVMGGVDSETLISWESRGQADRSDDIGLKFKQRFVSKVVQTRVDTSL